MAGGGDPTSVANTPHAPAPYIPILPYPSRKRRFFSLTTRPPHPSVCATQPWPVPASPTPPASSVLHLCVRPPLPNTAPPLRD